MTRGNRLKQIRSRLALPPEPQVVLAEEPIGVPVLRIVFEHPSQQRLGIRESPLVADERIGGKTITDLRCITAIVGQLFQQANTLAISIELDRRLAGAKQRRTGPRSSFENLLCQ